MELVRLSANKPGFKEVRFRPGLNLIVAERGDESSQGESRNGTGKTSLVRLLRYLLGGNLPSHFKIQELEDWEFYLETLLPGSGGEVDRTVVTRAVSTPRTKLSVRGWTRMNQAADQHKVADWRERQARYLFSLGPDHPSELTAMSLWAYFLRDHFDDPRKAVRTDPDWLIGLKLGYLLGLAPDALSRSERVAKLERQQKALKDAISEGALEHLDLNEARYRSDLAGARSEKARLTRRIEQFRVDYEYEENQHRANELTQRIRDINENLLALENRASELQRAIESESEASSDNVRSRVGSMYRELGLVLPEKVTKRFEDVEAFHESLMRNRAQHLSSERDDVQNAIDELTQSRARLDEDRAAVMTLLKSSVAFDTFVQAQSRIAQLDATIAEIQRRLETAASVSTLESTIKAARNEAQRSVSEELHERESFLVDQPLAIFRDLGNEIYDDRTANLLLTTNKKGGLSVDPTLSGDHSNGIRGVETFLLDMTLLITSMGLGRSPGILVHDSHLFDAVDHRQVASCLNIGARLAEEYNFQYIVTMNSDFLSSVEKEGSFDSSPYHRDVGLTDTREDGGLFGFRFD